MPATTKAPLYTVTTLSQALDVSQPQVSAWKTAGMPFNRAGRITMAAAVQWLRDRAAKDRPKIGASEANARRAQAEAEMAELELAKELGDLVPAAEVFIAAEEEATRVRSIVAQLASSHAPMIAAELGCGLRDASSVLRRLSDELLRELAADDEEEAA